MRTCALGAITLGAFAWAMACSSGDPEGGGAPGKGPRAGETSGGDKPGGGDDQSGDGTGDGKTPAGPTTYHVATVSLSSNALLVSGMEYASHSAFASFARGTTSGGGTTCTNSTEGSCKIFECPIAKPVDAGAYDAGDAGGDAAAPVLPNAGKITVAGGLIPAAGLALLPGVTGAYGFATGTTKLWAGGEEIKIAAAGGEVPAFEHTVRAPSQITVTSPAFPAAGKALDVSRASALDVRWTGGAAGDVTILLTSTNADASGIVTCTFPASAGEGSVPAAAVAKLPSASGAGDTGSFAVQNTGVTKAKVGEWDLTVTASTIARAGGSFASTSARFQ